MRRFENGLDGSEVVPLQVRLEEGDRRGLGDSIEEVLERVNLTIGLVSGRLSKTDTFSVWIFLARIYRYKSRLQFHSRPHSSKTLRDFSFCYLQKPPKIRITHSER